MTILTSCHRRKEAATEVVRMQTYSFLDVLFGDFDNKLNSGGKLKLLWLIVLYKYQTLLPSVMESHRGQFLVIYHLHYV